MESKLHAKYQEKLKSQIKKSATVPLVADIHFDYMMALEAIKGKADCIRINPGNIGKEEKIKRKKKDYL